jgi:mRNA interferase MazF
MPTGFRRGEVRLANFNPSKGTEPGKIRPCLIIQSDLLNEADHPSTTVLPLTSRLVEGAAPLRFRIDARDGLRTDSDVMLDQIRTIDNRRIMGEPLTILRPPELAEVEEYLKIVLSLPAI